MIKIYTIIAMQMIFVAELWDHFSFQFLGFPLFNEVVNFMVIYVCVLLLRLPYSQVMKITFWYISNFLKFCRLAKVFLIILCLTPILLDNFLEFNHLVDGCILIIIQTLFLLLLSFFTYLYPTISYFLLP
jgi:hypothetical protein